MFSAIAGGIASSLVSGLFGKKSKKGPSLEEQYAAHAASQHDLARTLPSSQVAGWKAAGIHPLAGLGMASPGVPGFSSIGQEDNSHQAWADQAGQGVSRAVSAYMSREEREISRLSSKLALENQQLQNDRLRSEIALMSQPGTGPSVDSRYPESSSMPMGFGDTAPLLRLGRDSKGNPVRVWNDDLGDNEIMQALSSVLMTVPDYIHGNVTRPGGRSLKRFLSRLSRGASNPFNFIKERR